MIIKRNEKDEAIIGLYDSTNIISSNYDKNKKELVLIFQNGGRFKYQDVSNSDYYRFEIAESQGKVFHSHIKSHKTEKLSNVNINEYLCEVNDIINTEKNMLVLEKQKQLLPMINKIIENDNKKQIPELNDIVLLQNQISEIITILKK